MSDLIDRLEKIAKHSVHTVGENIFLLSLDDGIALYEAIDIIKQQQWIPVVRCKDCKWYQEGYDIDGKWFTRCNGSVRTYGHTNPDWFCGNGKRREDEDIH